MLSKVMFLRVSAFEFNAGDSRVRLKRKKNVSEIFARNWNTRNLCKSILSTSPVYDLILLHPTLYLRKGTGIVTSLTDVT